MKSLSNDQRSSLKELADAETAMDYVTVDLLAGAMASAFRSAAACSTSSSTVPPAEVISRNKQALLAVPKLSQLVASWGDGFSVSMLDAMSPCWC